MEVTERGIGQTKRKKIVETLWGQPMEISVGTRKTIGRFNDVE